MKQKTTEIRCDGIQKEHEAKIEEWQEKCDELEKSLSGKIAECMALQEKIKEYEELSLHTLETECITPFGDYNYISLCLAYTDERGKSRLRRMADVRDNKFSKDFLEEAPHYENLYREDEQNRDGYIGVWDWKVIPNWRDPSKDYIISHYRSDIHPIEICILNGCYSIPELLKKMKAGIFNDFHTAKVMVSINNGSSYEGIYCDSEVATIQSGKLSIKRGVMKLPIFEFSASDFIAFDKAIIMNRVGLRPSKFVRVKDPLEVVQELIVQRATWSAMQQRDLTQKEVQKIKNFLSNLPIADLYKEIGTSCDCDIDEAKDLVDRFVLQGDTFICGKTLENDIMAQIIRNNENLYDNCLKELGKDWEARNQTKVSEAQAALKNVQEEEIHTREACEKERLEYEQLSEQIRLAKAKITEQECLAKEVETRVQKKIEQARNHAAEFIAEQAFIHVSTHSQEKVTYEKAVIDSPLAKSSYFFTRGKEFVSEEEPDTNENWEQLLQTVQNELDEAGVAKEYVNGLSALLYSAYINQIPLLFAGPNGADIAKAFSISISCRIPATLRCEGKFSSQAITDCESSGDNIVVIEYPFQAEWQNNIIKLISKRDKFYIVVHPFAEDLVIEPRGLFNYCIPILTEVFVDKMPTNKYVGGCLKDNFQQFENKETVTSYNKLLKKMRVNSIAKANIQKIVSDTHKLLKNNNIDNDYQLILYPIAYAFSELDTLSNYLDNTENLDNTEKKPSGKVLKFLKQLIGDEE